jgi:hypothetical protein
LRVLTVFAPTPQAIYHPQLFGLAPYPTVDPVVLCAGNGSDCGADTSMYSGTVGVNTGVYGAINALTGIFADAGGIMAPRAATGGIRWIFDATTVPNTGGATASAAVYEINGVEYVVYGFGGNPQGSYLPFADVYHEKS